MFVCSPCRRTDFYAGFDGSLEPASARGSKTFKTETPVSFQDGIRGKALVIGTDPQGVRHGVAYPHEKNLNWTEGAISFWLKPVNWKGSDTGFLCLYLMRKPEKLFHDL